ncbi:MAG: SDR family oxidoreductase [Halodesulfurarchaeum sp.]
MDRTVLITGCSSGIGRATVEAFLDAEWRVVATARSKADLRDLERGGAHVRTLDVTKPAQCQSVVEWTVEETGRLDCLVNNAGYAQFGPLEDVPTRRVEEQFEVNVFGPHRLVRAALSHLRESAGTIVQVGSVSGRLSAPGMGAYAGSKAALELMSDALRVELATDGVDVSVVEPGPVETSFDDRATDSMADLDRSERYADVYSTLEDASFLGSLGSIPPSAVAGVILEAASSTDPDPRYPVGTPARYLLWARFVPDRLRDRVFALLRRLGA